PCKRTNQIVGQLLELEYDDGVEYKVTSVDHSSKQEMKLINECFTVFSNIDYVPQVLCPANGKDLTGEFSLGQLRNFADQCIEDSKKE
ncbi:hypothetical protein ACFLRF_03565, partial [Candidatus Altiarchaeota archaeon]